MPRSFASTVSSPSTWALATVLGLAASHVAVAQTAAEISTEQNTLSTLIPGACEASCTAWLTSLAACPAAASATYSNCVCDATFIANFQTCAPCLATQLAAQNDATDAATANQAPTDLTNFCAAAGTSLTSATTTSTTSTTSTTATTAVTSAVSSGSGLNNGANTIFTPTTPLLTFSTVSSTSSASVSVGTSVDTDLGPKTITQSGQNLPFPTQSKGANAFASGAGSNVRSDKSAAVAMALFAVVGGWLLV